MGGVEAQVPRGGRGPGRRAAEPWSPSAEVPGAPGSRPLSRQHGRPRSRRVLPCRDLDVSVKPPSEYLLSFIDSKMGKSPMKQLKATYQREEEARGLPALSRLGGSTLVAHASPGRVCIGVKSLWSGQALHV